METYDFATYMEGLATILTDISHDSSNRKTKRFLRVSGILNMEQVLQNFTSINGRLLVVQDNLSGSFLDRRSDHILEDQYFTFFVLEKAKWNDMSNRNTQIAACHNTMKKILARIRYDKKRNLNGLLYFDFNSVKYDVVEPVADNYLGVWCSFTLTQSANLFINRDDWTDGNDFDLYI
jgi:hypothetical protein